MALLIHIKYRQWHLECVVHSELVDHKKERVIDESILRLVGYLCGCAAIVGAVGRCAIRSRPCEEVDCAFLGYCLDE